ncbi:MAG: DNA translocase FtsK 4TM domain-containing protein, partial [Caulobacteraceae bacterium]
MTKAARSRSREALWALHVTKAAWEAPLIRRSRGVVTALMGAALALSLGGYHAADASFDTASSGSPANWLG